MTALNLSPDSEILKKILRNRVLFTYCVQMISQDIKLEWDHFKYLGVLTNPEGFRELENTATEPKYKNIFQQYSDGHQATEAIKKLNLSQNSSDQQEQTDQQEGILAIG